MFLKKLFVSMLIVLVSGILLSSCSSQKLPDGLPGHAKYIPSDAIFTYIADLKSISEKGNFKQLLDIPTVKEMISIDPNLKNLIENPETAGIDMKKDYITFGVKRNMSFIVNTMIPLKDKTALESTLAASGLPIDIKEDGKIKYTQIEEKIVAAWNDEVLLVSGNFDYYDFDLLLKDVKEIFSMPESSSLGAVNKEFADFYRKDYDLGLWLYITPFLKEALDASQSFGMAVPLGADMKKMLESDIYFECTAGFNTGKISIEAEYIVTPEIVQFYNKFIGKKINPEFMTGIPGSELFGMFSFSTDMKNAKDYIIKTLTEQGILPMVQTTVKDEIDYNFEDILDIFGGQAAVFFNGMENMIPYYTVTASVNDQTKLDDLLQKFVGLNQITDSGDFYSFSPDNYTNLYMFSKDDKFYVTNSAAVKSSVLDGKKPEKEIPSEIVKMITDYKGSAFFDLIEFIDLYKTDINEMETFAEINQISSFEAKGPEVTNNSYVYYIDIKMKDKQKNSLSLIIDMIKGAAESEEF